MKLNNPATLLLGAAIVGVGIMALAGRGRAAYTENDCSRVVIKSVSALESRLQSLDAEAQRLLTNMPGATPAEISDALVDLIMEDLVPGCPSPLSDETVLVFEDGSGDGPMTLGEIREQMRMAVEIVLNQAGAGGRRGLSTRAMAGAFMRG